MNLKTILFIVIFIIPHTATALTAVVNFTNTTIPPDTTMEVGNITLAAENESVERINIFILGTPYTFAFSHNDFNLSNATATVNVHASAIEYTSPGTYNATIVITSNATPIFDVVQFTTPVIKNFTSYPEISSLSVDTNSSGRFTIKIENLGNVMLTLTGECDVEYFHAPDDIILPQFAEVDVPISYQIPANTIPRQTVLKCSFSSDNITSTSSLNLTILDRIYPSVEINFKKNLGFGEKQEIKIKSKDNVGIHSESLAIINPKNEIITDKIFIADVPGRWNITYTVNDTSGNTVEIENYFTVSKINDINLSEIIDFGRIKINEWAFAHLLTNKQPTSFNLTIVNFSGPSSISEIRVGGIPFVNDKIKFDGQQGDLVLQVKNNRTGIYKFTIHAEMPDYFDLPYYDTYVEVEFTSYSIVKNYSTTWFGYKAECEGIDTGKLETSKFKCCLTLPATQQIEKLSLPCSIEWINDLKTNHKAQIAIKERIISSLSAQSSLWFFLFILFSIMFIYAVFIYPRFRWRIR